MFLRDQDPIDEQPLNLTSMTDLVFLLLVFFLCATTLMRPERALEVELPSAEHSTRVEDPLEELVINVLRDGAISIGGRTVDRAGLESELMRAASSNPNRPITIRGDRQVHHEAIVGVMDACGAAGLANLAVGTLEGS